MDKIIFTINFMNDDRVEHEAREEQEVQKIWAKRCDWVLNIKPNTFYSDHQSSSGRENRLQSARLQSIRPITFFTDMSLTEELRTLTHEGQRKINYSPFILKII